MKRLYETCFEDIAAAAAPSSKRLTLKHQIHPFLLSYPGTLDEGLWLFVSTSDGQISAVNSACQKITTSASEVPHYAPFKLHNASDPHMSVDATCYETFARGFLWHLPQYLQTNFQNPRKMHLRSLHLDNDGPLYIYTDTGDIIIGRDEAMVPFLALENLKYSLKGWAIVLEASLHEISSFKDFRLERI